MRELPSERVDGDVFDLVDLVETGVVSRRGFMIRMAALGISATSAAAVLAACTAPAASIPSTGPAASSSTPPSAAPGSSAPTGQSLDEMKALVFGAEGFFPDPAYVGPNSGGQHGRLPVGDFPTEPLSFLKVRASQP